MVKGFDICNTYGPNTGDIGKAVLWGSIMVLSMMSSLAAAVVYLKKEEEI